MYKILNEYIKHVDLIASLVFELTKAANHIITLVRKYIDPLYRYKEGVLIVTTGSLNCLKHRLEYK